jgi:hypothetical protein
MSDPAAATATQIRNIEAKTGKSLAELAKLIADSDLSKVGEQRSHLMQTLGLGYGDANAVAILAKQAAAPAPAADADPLAAIYSGKKAALRPLHEALMARLAAFGPFEIAPKQAYVSLRRKKQFAMLGPATQTALELGLDAKGLEAASARLKAMPAGGMCSHAVRLSSEQEIDAELLAWARAAYDGAG